MNNHDSTSLENADCLWAARRLKEVTNDIQVFFENQIVRVANSLAICEDAINEGEVVQNLMLKLKQEQGAWESARDQEIQRLTEASRRLEIEWGRLESARREFMLDEAGRKGKPVASSLASARSNSDAQENSTRSAMPRSSREALNMIEDLRNEIHAHAKQKH